MGLLQNLSMVPRRVGHHELLLRADVLVHPQDDRERAWLAPHLFQLLGQERGRALLEGWGFAPAPVVGESADR